MTNPHWKTATNQVYVENLLRSRAIWIGNCFDPQKGIPVGKKWFPLYQILIVNKIKSRECTITCQDWNSFISKCYTLGCKDCGQNDEDGWTAVKGKKLKFYEWIKRYGISEKSEEFFKYDDEKFRDNNTILTVYDETKRKRMIIDGLHRCVAITGACKDDVPISKVRILECFGKNINSIFPLDIHQLPKK